MTVASVIPLYTQVPLESLLLPLLAENAQQGLKKNINIWYAVDHRNFKRRALHTKSYIKILS